MKASLGVKLSAAFLAVALAVLLIVGVVINTLVGRQFRDYVVGKQEQRIRDTLALVAGRYSDWGGKWDAVGLETIGVNALGEGLIITVRDLSGSAVWDARVHNGGMCSAIIEHMAANMQSLAPNFQGGYEEREYPIEASGQPAGSVTVGYYGPYFYSDNDVRFLDTINNLLLWSALIAAAGSTAFGLIMARRLTRPIRRVIDTAKSIARGEFDDRVRASSGTREIVELAAAVNSLAETLGKQDRLRRRLTADVAHELRTPLATIQSHLEAMIDGIWAPDTARLTSCHEETVRLSKLVGDMERLTRYEDGNLILDRKRFDLSALLKRIASNFESQFLGKGVRLELSCEEAWIYADEDKISQVFVNLLSNAWKYTPAGGSAELFARREAGRVLSGVRDTGVGIAEEDLPYIFERFYRTDKSRNRTTGGSGIGLTIAKSIVVAHGASIDVASRPGSGSVFTVTFPEA